MKRKKDYPEELTADMHSEFTISNNAEIELRAGCVWGMVLKKKLTSKNDIEKECKGYGISYEDAMNYRDKWIKIIEKSPSL